MLGWLLSVIAFALVACEVSTAPETVSPPTAATPSVAALATAAPTQPPTPTVEVPAERGTTDASPIEGGTLIAGALTDAKTLNSILAADATSRDVTFLLGNRLINVKPDLMPEGDLADSWSVSADGLKITFTLKRGVKFHDGHDLTAEDVKFTYDSILNPLKASPFHPLLADYWAAPNAIKVIDAYTVEFNYARPKADTLVYDFGVSILPKHILGDVSAKDFGSAEFNTQKPIYSGPFMFKEWVKGDHLTLEANPNYFKGKPRLGAYIVKVYPQLTSLLGPLRAGEIDWGALDPGQMADAKQLARVTTYAYPTFKSTYYAYQLDPTKSTLFQDKRVRQALLYAVDRRAIIARRLFGYGDIAPTTIAPHSWASSAAVQSLYPFDPDKAKTLLTEAGWTAGVTTDGVRVKDGKRFSFTLLTNADNRVRADAIVEMQRYWKDVGVESKPQTDEWNAFLKRIGATPDSAHDFDIFVVGFNWSIDPNQKLMWHSASIQNGVNFNPYKNAELDKLLDDGYATFNLSERKALYAKAQQLLADDVPSVVLFFEQATGG
ncbi:MAG: ABC transporter substrate-binding protein, partial [Chloroflexota bacterium]